MDLDDLIFLTAVELLIHTKGSGMDNVHLRELGRLTPPTPTLEEFHICIRGAKTLWKDYCDFKDKV